MVIRCLRAGAFALLMLAPAVGAVVAEEQDGDVVPEVGTASTVFTFSGSGMEPGAPMAISFVSPRSLPDASPGAPIIITTARDGRFTTEFRVSGLGERDPRGTWIVHGCIVDSDDCVFAEFEVE